jgi:hypothetical protein
VDARPHAMRGLLIGLSLAVPLWAAVIGLVRLALK